MPHLRVVTEFYNVTMLDEEDKKWLVAEMARLGESLLGEIGSLRGDVGSLGSELGSLRGELHREVESLRAEFSERLERTETNLLTEFHKWAVPNEARQRGFSERLRSRTRIPG